MKIILWVISLSIMTNLANADMTSYEGFDYVLNRPLTGLDGGIG
jgi:hypothetical protein